MNHPIRRKDRAISEGEARAILEKAEYGVLCTVGGDNQPYGVPLSFIVLNNAVYIHCANAGHKLDNLAFNPAVSFTVVGATEPVFDKSFSTYYESAIVFGKARQVTDEEEKRDALMEIARKYLPEHMDKADDYIAKSFSRTVVYAFSIDSITGKAKKKTP